MQGRKYLSRSDGDLRPQRGGGLGVVAHHSWWTDSLAAIGWRGWAGLDCECDSVKSAKQQSRAAAPATCQTE